MKPIALKQKWHRTFDVSEPFSFRTTMRKPSHFPTPLELFPDDDTYMVAAYVDENLLGVRAQRNRPREVEITLYTESDLGASQLDAAALEMARRLGLTVAVDGFSEVWARDDLLRSLDKELMGGRPSMPHSLYHFLVICVLLQNTQVRRTVQMTGVLLSEFGTAVVFPGGETIPVFGTPEQLADAPEAMLRDLKLGYRAKSIHRLSNQFAADPTIEQSLLRLVDATELRQALLALYGVGPATAGYLSFEWFKNCNDLVHMSPWEAKILGRILFGEEVVTERLIAEIHDRWEPFTMLATHAVFESIFWMRTTGAGPDWLEPLIRL